MASSPIHRPLHRSLSCDTDQVPPATAPIQHPRNSNQGTPFHGSTTTHSNTTSAAMEAAKEQQEYRLQRELNESSIKHQEQIYWLKFELDTTRREKEAVEDRMAELYRDLQEMQELNPSSSSNHSRGTQKPPVIVDHDYVFALQNQIEKHERMFRVMNNQIGLVRSSTDAIVKSLKDELSELMDEKSRMEMDLLNKMSDIDRERRELAFRLEIATQGKPPPPVPVLKSSTSFSGAPTKKGDAETKALKNEIERLQLENKKLVNELANERSRAKDCMNQMAQEKEILSSQVDQLQNELLVVRASAEAVQNIDAMHQDREETLSTLERVALLWDRADESIQNLESAMMQLRPRDDPGDDDRERLLSTLETATLVHGQVKVSLMLVELKLRNNLACLSHDQMQMGPYGLVDEALRERLSDIRNEAMAAIMQIESLVQRQIEELEVQSTNESKVVRETLEAKVEELKRMQTRQFMLEEAISTLQREGKGEAKEEVDEEGNVELFVSRKMLERLQNEVLQVVERVKEKNETIGRLTATVEEHKVRERALMDELKRHMKEQAERQLREQRRIMRRQDMRDSSEDDEEQFTDFSTSYHEDDPVGVAVVATTPASALSPIVAERPAIGDASEFEETEYDEETLGEE